MLSLAAWYAPRGISPKDILAAKPAELILLNHAKNEYIKQQILLTKTAVLAAFDSDTSKEVAQYCG